MRLGSVWLLFFASVVTAVVALGCERGHGGQAGGSQSGGARPTAPPLPPRAVDGVAAGAQLYEKYCQLCHAKDASGYAADNAPSLVSKTFLESASDELIAAGIRMGRPNTAMAAYGKQRGGPLEESEIASLVKFLRSRGPQAIALPAANGGDPRRGQVVLDENCIGCHGTATVHGPTALNLFNPELLNAASPAFLRYAIVHGRPPTPMPSFAGKLSEQEIDDVVALIWELKPKAPTPPVAELQVPKDLPIVINPKGKQANFTLREGRFVAAEQVKKALDGKQRIVIVDARPGSDWIQFHIPGAISGPYHDRTELERIPKDGTWVVAYCACPHHASGEVVDALRDLKYPNTAVLDEGILFWKDHGYPLAGEAVPKLAAPVPSAKKH